MMNRIGGIKVMAGVFEVGAILLFFVLSCYVCAYTYDNDLALGWHWSAASGNIDHYNVKVQLNETGPFVEIGVTSSCPTSSNPYIITGTAHTVYVLKVQAESASGDLGPNSEESEPAVCTPGDVNYDGFVDIDDFSQISFHWGETGSMPADLNDDEFVDIDDFTLVSFHWGEVYSSNAPPLPKVDRLFIKSRPLAPHKAAVWILVDSTQEVDILGFQLIAEDGWSLNLADHQCEWVKVFSKHGGNNNLVVFAKPGGQSGKFPAAYFELSTKKEDFAKEMPDILASRVLIQLRYGQLMNKAGKTSFCSAFHEVALQPRKDILLQNFPNPANPETWIPYGLAEPSEVKIDIFSLNGELVRSLKLGLMQRGWFLNKTGAVHWDGRNEAGERVVSGVYFYMLTTGKLGVVKKMIIK